MKEGTIKEGYKMTITDAEGTVMDVVELGGYDLSKPFPRSDIIDQIRSGLPQEAFNEEASN